MYSKIPFIGCFTGFCIFASLQLSWSAEPKIAFGVDLISAGEGYTAFLESNGSLYAVGDNRFGQLGDGSSSTRSDYLHISTGISSFSSGGNHMLVLKKDGSLWAVGSNEFGQLGDGSNENSFTFKSIVASGVTSIAAGESHSLFVKSDGSLWAMGSNITGQLGNGDTVDVHSPTKVVDSGVSTVSAGGGHTLFLKTDGSLWAMGAGWSGALGLGSTDDNATSNQVVPGNVASVSAGGNHSLFLKTDGSLWAMGSNSSGQLGDGSTTNRLTPVEVITSGVVAAVAGGNHSLFLKNDGSLWSMGENSHGQLGDGSKVNRATPTQIQSSGVAAIAVGHSHSLFATSSNELKAMGRNTRGGLGDGSTEDSIVPVVSRDGSLRVFMSEDGLPSAWVAPQLVAADSDGVDSLTWSVSSMPSNGSLAFSGTGASPSVFSYVPDGNFSGNDSFVVKVDDATSADTITVNVVVESVNDAPGFALGSSLSVSMSEDGSPMPWGFPRLEFSDAEGDALNWFVETEPSHGNFFFEVNGSFVTLSYSPDSGFVGSDAFKLGVSDGSVANALSVNVEVLPVNDPPSIAQGEEITDTLVEGEMLSTVNAPTLTATDPDGDSLSWNVLTQAAHGLAIVSGTGNSPQVFSYAPLEDFFGEDSFVIMVTDGDLNDTIEVKMVVSGVNDQPIVVGGTSLTVTMSEEGSPIPWVVPNLSATDADGDTLTWTLANAPANGLATVSGSGESPVVLDYVPHKDFNGTDAFVIRLDDGVAPVDITVEVVVEAVNEPPEITQGESLSVTMSEDGSPAAWTAPSLTGADEDSAEESLAWSLGSLPTFGTAVVSGSGASPSVFQYEPASNFYGIDTFVVTVGDGNASDSITIQVSVNPVNDVPRIDQNSTIQVTMSEDEAPIAWVAPVLTASDDDNDTLTWNLSTQPSSGTASVGGEGLFPDFFIYDPDPGFVGNDSFSVTVSDGNATSEVTVNVQVLPSNVPPRFNHGVRSIALGEDFSYYLDSNGSLYSTGFNSYGQLGDGTTNDRSTFFHVDVNVTEVSAGGGHALFVKSDGSLWAVGSNDNGQLGDGTLVDRSLPVRILDSGVNAVEAGEKHSLFIKSDGSLWAMGDNSSGQLGDGSSSDRTVPTMVLDAGVTSVSAGSVHSLVVKSDGSLWAMGSNARGAFGSSTRTDSTVPVQSLSSGVSSVTAGRDFSLVVTSDGALLGMGANDFGQLGSGDYMDSISPFVVLTSGVSIASSGLGATSLFVKTNGSLWTMGDNSFGQLGEFSENNSSSPVEVISSGVFSAAMGSTHSLAAMRDASIMSFGRNHKGALGDGTTANTSTPKVVVRGDLLVSMSEDGSPTQWTLPSLLAFDHESDVLTWSVALQPSNGSATFSGTGGSPSVALYQPEGNYSGVDSFAIQVSDGMSSSIVNVRVEISPSPDAPAITQGNSVSVSMSEDSSPTVWSPPFVTAVDSDGDSLTWSLSTAPQNGNAIVGGLGQSPSVFLYSPNSDFAGSDNFEIQVSDGQFSDRITVLVSVEGVNDPPSLSSDFALSLNMSEDGSPSVWIPPNISASDPDAGDVLTWSLWQSPVNGTAEVSGTGSQPTNLNYQPKPNFHGSDSFVVQVSDGNSTDQLTLNVSILSVPDAPSIDEGDSITFAMSEDGSPIAWNYSLKATDPDAGDVLTWSLHELPARGTASVSGNGNSPSVFLYQPPANWFGTDSFKVRVNDGVSSDLIAVHVVVESVNDLPVIDQGSEISIAMSEDGVPLQWPIQTISASDLERWDLTWLVSRFPANGISTLSPQGASSVNLSYQPFLNFAGSDAFDLQVSDGNATATLTVKVSVSEVNDAPVITQGNLIEVSMSEDGTPTPWVSPDLNVSDPDPSDLLTWSVVIAPLNGVLELNVTNTSSPKMSFVPNDNWHGQDSFVLQVSDGEVIDAVTVKVEVVPVNDAPVIEQGSTVSVKMSEDSSPLAWEAPNLSGIDPEGDSITWSLVSIPSFGAASAGGTGKSPTILDYTPNLDFFGFDSFHLSASDGSESSEVRVVVEVEAVDDLPSRLEFHESGDLFENSPVGTVVGRILPANESNQQPLSFKLAPDASGSSLQNLLFSLDENGTLKVNSSLDFETDPKPRVNIQVANPSGESMLEAFAVSLTDVFRPGVNTFPATEVTSSSALLHGKVEDAGDDPNGVSERGFALGVRPDPSLSDENVTRITIAHGNDLFDSSVTSLVPGRVYYFRAYAINSEGTSYGPQRRFVTSEKIFLGPLADATNVTGNWWSSNWFGNFYATDAEWVYHEQLGWIFLHGQSPSGFWIWQSELGWLWTSAQAFSYLYSNSTGNWLLFKDSIEGEAVFFDFSKVAWVSHRLLSNPAKSRLYK